MKAKNLLLFLMCIIPSIYGAVPKRWLLSDDPEDKNREVKELISPYEEAM